MRQQVSVVRVALAHNFRRAGDRPTLGLVTQPAGHRRNSHQWPIGPTAPAFGRAPKPPPLGGGVFIQTVQWLNDLADREEEAA